jgi:hypothetical protein
MKHASTRELHAYWTARRGTRPAPERNDIEPGAIRRVLADTFMLNFDIVGGHPFRIAGTRVCAAFGRELKGAAFVDIWAADSRELVRDILSIVATESIGRRIGREPRRGGAWARAPGAAIGAPRRHRHAHSGRLGADRAAPLAWHRHAAAPDARDDPLSRSADRAACACAGRPRPHRRCASAAWPSRL